MKKILVMMLSLLMTVCMIGCGGSSDTEEPEATTDVAEEQVVEEPEAEESNDSTSGLRTDFKEAMDSYEEFFDEYVEFMKKHENSDDQIGMMTDLADYMTKYSEVMEKMDAWESEDMTDEELAYYLEVTSRITKKLAEVA